ncbi:hypothetical protein Ancab_027021 [Ancistrocladus abbreviatus]
MGSCASIHRNSDSASKQLQMSFVPSNTDQHSVPSTPVKTAAVAQVSPFNSVTAAGYQSSAGSKEETFFDSQAWLESDCDDDFYSVNGDFTPSRGSTPVHGSAAGTPRINKTLSLQANGALFEGRPSSNSESTKSCGGTLLHHSVSAKSIAPQASKTAMEGKGVGPSKNASSSSSPDKKKKLVDLFRESRGGCYDDGLSISGPLGESDVYGKLETKPNAPRSENGTPNLSGANSVSSVERTPIGECKSKKDKLLKSAQCCFPRLAQSYSFYERKKAATGCAPIIVDA